MWRGSDMAQQFLQTIAILSLCTHAWLGYHNLYGDAILVASWATYSYALWSWRLDCLTILFRHVARMVASLFRRQDPSIVSMGLPSLVSSWANPLTFNLHFAWQWLHCVSRSPAVCWTWSHHCSEPPYMDLGPSLFLSHDCSWTILVLEPSLFLSHSWTVHDCSWTFKFLSHAWLKCCFWANTLSIRVRADAADDPSSAP